MLRPPDPNKQINDLDGQGLFSFSWDRPIPSWHFTASSTMVPLLVRPSLVLSEPFRPTGQPNLDSWLMPGEAVQATVLNVQDDGALLLLVKGVMLRAASLIGRLPVGQVVNAQVESRGGQVLLRLDQPLQPATANQIEGLAADQDRAIRQGGIGATMRTAAFLKTLLPTDEPLASGLARLSASLTAAAGRGELTPQTLARFQALAQQIRLAPEQAGAPLAGEHIRRVLLALGVQHEPALLAEWSRTGTITWREGAPNLKVLLMALLAEAAADGPATQASSGHAESPARSAGPAALPTVLASPVSRWTQGRDSVQGVFSDIAGRQGTAGFAPRPLDQPTPVRLAGAMTPPSQFAAEVLVQPEKSAVVAGPSPVPASPVRQGGIATVPVPSQTLSGQSKGEAQAAAAVGAGPGPPSSFPNEEGLVRGDQQPLSEKLGPVVRAAGGPSSFPLGLAAQQDESATLPAAPSLSGQSGRHEPEGLGRGGWIRDAQQVLAMIERTQTLAALNGQAGQPILFELPLAGGGQVWLAVEERPAGGGRSQDRPRSYSVVTLLNLDGLGSVRVDTLLTGKRLSARLLLDQPEVRQRVTGYLPVLNASLSAKGYRVDLLTIDLGEPQLVRGEDIRARALPRVSLVNRKV